MENAVVSPGAEWPGPDDIAYQAQAQAGGFRQTLESFLKFLDLPPDAVVLDVGTGPGVVVRLLAARMRFVVGSDRLPEMLAHARSLLPGGAPVPAAWAAADALRLPFASESFDAALATNLLFLLPDPAVGLAELARVVRPGGIAGWLNPSEQLSQSSAAAFAGARGMTGFARFSLVNYGRIAEGYHRLSGDQWAGLAARAGLEDVRFEGRGGGLMTIVKGRKPHHG